MKPAMFLLGNKPTVWQCSLIMRYISPSKWPETSAVMKMPNLINVIVIYKSSVLAKHISSHWTFLPSLFRPFTTVSGAPWWWICAIYSKSLSLYISLSCMSSLWSWYECSPVLDILLETYSYTWIFLQIKCIHYTVCSWF